MLVIHESRFEISDSLDPKLVLFQMPGAERSAVVVIPGAAAAVRRIALGKSVIEPSLEETGQITVTEKDGWMCGDGA